MADLRFQISNYALFETAAPVDEAFDHLIESLRLLAVAEVAGPVDDMHLGFRADIGDQLEEHLAALELRGRVVVAPYQQRRLSELALHDPIQRLFLVHRQVGEELFFLESLVLHLSDGFLVFRRLRDVLRFVEPGLRDVVRPERVVFDAPALAFPAQARFWRFLHDGFGLRRPGGERAAVDDHTRAHQLGVIQSQPGDDVTAARVADDVDVFQTQSLDEASGVFYRRRPRVVPGPLSFFRFSPP